MWDFRKNNRNGKQYAIMSLVGICGIAFCMVLSLLTLLAGMIFLLGKLFPDPEAKVDPAVIVGIHNAVSMTLPGAKVVKIVETKR
jgi:uncharacterized protein (DUF697 family)